MAAPLACGGSHIIIYCGYCTAPASFRFGYTGETLILPDVESPSPIYIGGSGVFNYLEGTHKFRTSVWRKYDPMRKLLKLGPVLQHTIQVDNIAVQVVEHFHGERLRQMPKDRSSAGKRLYINLAIGYVLNNPLCNFPLSAWPSERCYNLAWCGDAVQKLPFQLLNGFF
jgi:hypothetical protein